MIIRVLDMRGAYVDDGILSMYDMGSRTSSMNGGTTPGEDIKGLRIPYESSDDSGNDDFHDAFDEAVAKSSMKDIIKTEQMTTTSAVFNIVDLQMERSTLPHMRPPNQKISFIQLLKEVIGKDLSKISFPVYLNEPLSIV